MKQMNMQTYFRLSLTMLALSAGLSSCLKEDLNTSEGKVGEMITLLDVRQAYKGNDVTLNTASLNGGTTIAGVVISDKDGKNLPANSLVLQQTAASANSFTDMTRGIVINMTSEPTYAIGDSLHINVTGAKLGRVGGNLTISGIAAGQVTVMASGKAALVRPVTMGKLHSTMEYYESTLVSLNADAVDAPGSTLAGSKAVADQTGDAVYVYTRSAATHAGDPMPVSAQFTGIAARFNETGNDTFNTKKVIMPRNTADVQWQSGVMYSGFPESFESPEVAAKSSYNSGTNQVTLKTGSWTLLQGILANTAASDRYNEPGKQCIRMQQNLTTVGTVQMNFDVTEGASKVTVFYGRYSTDARSQFRLEASTNGGTTWTTVGSTITAPADKEFRQAVWMVNYTGNVRFRLAKLGLGTSNNGRLNFDDFVIYKK